MAQITRRKFLIASGWVAGGVTALVALRHRAVAVAPTIIFPDGESGATWYKSARMASVKCFFPELIWARMPTPVWPKLSLRN